MVKEVKLDFNWKIAGEAGDGVMLLSKLVAKACKRTGLHVFNYYEYPSLIQGGHQTGQVYASSNCACSHKKKLDVLIALNKESLQLHEDELKQDTVIIYDHSRDGDIKALEIKQQVQLVNFRKKAQNIFGKVIYANMMVFGASCYILGLPKQQCMAIMDQELADKSEEVRATNKKAFDLGYESINQNKLKPINKIVDKKDEHILITGNEAIGLGALAAGIGYYSAYPMTPATALLHFLAKNEKHFPMIVKQTEDEIGAIHQAIGASVSGVRAMTGTSGGGFALMVEAVSFAGVAEIPLVILEAQRTGPASGLPTWTAQADMQFVIRSGHGDFPKIVLTPGDVQEHFDLTQKAFYLAEKYQLPVFILSDKYILESHQTMKNPQDVYQLQRQSMVSQQNLDSEDEFMRYKITDNGISMRSVPGQDKGFYLANSYEHDPHGFATEEIETTKAQVNKRARKIDHLISELPDPVLVGDKQAQVTLISFGSTVNVLRQLITECEYSINAIHIPCVWPLPKKTLENMFKSVKKLIVIEGNKSGQLKDLLNQELDIHIDDSIRRYDGRPFYVQEIIEQLKQKKLI